MPVPTGTYAVEYSLWLDDESGGTVKTSLDLRFPLADASQTPYTSAQQAAEDAAAEAAMNAWEASMQAAYPSVVVQAQRRYLVRADEEVQPPA